MLVDVLVVCAVSVSAKTAWLPMPLVSRVKAATESKVRYFDFFIIPSDI